MLQGFWNALYVIEEYIIVDKTRDKTQTREFGDTITELGIECLMYYARPSTKFANYTKVKENEEKNQV